MLRVACCGDSITLGTGIEEPSRSYPSVLQRLLGEKYEVRNFGRKGATAVQKGWAPYRNMKEYTAAIEYQPNVVILALGTNDSAEPNWQYRDSFVPEMQRIIDAFASLPSRPKIYLCLPPRIFNKKGYSDAAVLENIVPRIRQAADGKAVTLLDLHPAITDPEMYVDGLHPNAEGAAKLAEYVAKRVFNVAATTEPSPRGVNW